MAEARAWLGRLVPGERGRRLLVLAVVAVSCALLMVELSGGAVRDYAVGDVVERDIRAPRTFEFVDEAATESRRQAAEDAVLPVFEADVDSMRALQGRVRRAFERARRRHDALLLAAQAEERTTLTEAEVSEVARDFVADLEVHLDPVDRERLAALGWTPEAESLAQQLIEVGMRGYVVADRSVLPASGDAIAVVQVLPGNDAPREEPDPVTDLSRITTPPDARQRISLYAIENVDQDGDVEKVAVAVARALVRPNLSFSYSQTERRRSEAVEAVPEVRTVISRGTAIARRGDVLDEQQVAMISAVDSTRARVGSVGVVLALVAVVGLLGVSLFQFALGAFPRQSSRIRDLEASAVLLVLTVLVARLIVGASAPLAQALGDIPPSVFWYAAPLAGGAMLVRILINAELTLVWTLFAAVCLGLMMDQDVLYTVFFVISGVTAAGAVAGSRERVAVLKAGVLAGFFNAASALLLGLVQAYLGDPDSLQMAPLRLAWSVGFAFAGGALSGVLVLGLVPLFELVGFVTDYRLLELANLNHPLLRQLMLRAPGTYHHSVTVAQLSEAAAERVGANALQTRVACYFHDIGKAVSPKFFIENQRGGVNPHDQLPPHTSARVIINHVTDGEAIARQYKLPQPVIDGIVMHHGTGVIQYFYAMALKAAAPGESVDEDDFRYPGRLPDTREAGIMMLADKVEAASRTLKDKSPESIRGLIQKLVNATLMDGQLEKCPLTIKDLYTIIEAFTETLLGIYHHRIEYPGLPKRPAPRPSQASERPSGPVITLEIQNPLAQEAAAEPEPEPEPLVTESPSGPIDPQTGVPFMRPQRSITPDEDYESAEHLPSLRTWNRGPRE